LTSGDAVLEVLETTVAARGGFVSRFSEESTKSLSQRREGKAMTERQGEDVRSEKLSTELVLPGVEERERAGRGEGAFDE
jgi:hypothetical protein